MATGLSPPHRSPHAQIHVCVAKAVDPLRRFPDTNPLDADTDCGARYGGATAEGGCHHVILSFPARLSALATERPDAPAVTCGGIHAHPSRTRVASEPAGTRIAVVRRGRRRLRHGRRPELGRLVRRLPRHVEARRRPAAGLGEAARSGTRGDRRTRRIEGGDRRSRRSLRTPAGLDDPRPARSRAAAGILRRPPAGRRVARVEGAHVGWIDRSPEADRVGRPGRCSTPRPRPSSASATTDACSCPGRCTTTGPAVWSCQALLRGNHVVLLQRFDAEEVLAVDRAVRRRRGLPRADDDEAHPAARRRRAPRLRHVVAADRVAPRRAVPAVAEGGLDRLARPGADLRAVRRHRGAGGHDHHRHRVAGAPWFGRSRQHR